MNDKQKENFAKVLKSSKASQFTHGDCIGADLDAHKVAHDLGLAINKRPCDIERMRAWTSEGVNVAEPEPPLDRNKKIVDDGKILVACPAYLKEEQRSGTWATVRYARKCQKPIVLLWPDGRVEFENWANLKKV